MDGELNELGREQAEILAEKLKDVEFDVIVSSQLRRTLKTAEIINKYHGMPIDINDGLIERSGGTKLVAMNVWHDLFDFDKNVQPEGGESVRDFFERVYLAIDEIREKYGDKNVLVVSSGGVNQAFHAYFNKLEWNGNMRLDPMHTGDIRMYSFDEGVK